MGNIKNKHTLLLLHVSLLSLALGLPETFGFIALFAFVPLFLFIEKKPLNSTQLSAHFFSGLIISLATTSSFFKILPLDWMWWLDLETRHSNTLVFIFSWFLFSVLFAGLYLVFCVVVRKSFTEGKIKTALILSAWWVILEAVRYLLVSIIVAGEGSQVGLEYTLYSIAYSVSGLYPVNLLFSLGGLHLVSFFIIFTNHALCTFLKTKTFALTLGVTFFLVAVSCYGFFFQIETMRTKNKSKSIQLTIASTKIMAPKNKQEEQEKVGIVVNELLKNEQASELIVLPENINIFLDPASKDLSRQGNKVIGSKTDTSGNHVFYLDNQRGTTHTYKKEISMPVAEYEFSFNEYLLKKKYNQTKTNRNEEVSDGIKIFTSVCFENISPRLFREQVKNGSGVLVNISSHAIFRGSEQLRQQMLAINRARAIESNRYMVVVSNYSTSYVIDNLGIIEKELTPMTKVRLENIIVKILEKQTPYTRAGDYMLIVSVLLVIYFFARTRILGR